MNALQASYQLVIGHVTADIEALKQNARTDDKVVVKLLEKRREWLVHRQCKLNGNGDPVFTELKSRLDEYISHCEDFWKEMYHRTYEDKMDMLLDVKRRVAKTYALTGFDAYYALFITLKQLRNVLPLEPRDDAPVLFLLEHIKTVCMKQLKTYTHANRID